jgi:GntR family transcriptional regulator, transcriptional repressor for pyruvate dehydrogenase complex
VSAPLTEAAIQNMRGMIATGALLPGARLPPEAELARLLGASRNTVREAVRALVTARVLDVRRGDGTFVTSLRPELLLEGIGAAVELMQEGFTLELIGVRRILEPAATALAATRIGDDAVAGLGRCLQRMRDAESEAERIQHDADFHAQVAAASGNATLASMLNAVSSRTIRVRAWRGLMEEGAGARTVAQHQEILDALLARDPGRAEAAALVHVATTEAWARAAVGDWRPRPSGQPGPGPIGLVAEPLPAR